MRNRFVTIQVILNFLGSLFFVMGFILFVPILVGYLNGETEAGLSTYFAFLLPGTCALVLGGIFKIFFKKGIPNDHQAMLICALAWISFSAIGAIPFMLGINAGFLDGFFETMSGFTTTGITMFTGLDGMPRSILFWRALTQWVGGLGIITLFLAVNPAGEGAYRLFGAESHKIGMGRPVPGMANTLKILWAIYTGFTFLIIIGLRVAGMNLFDSVCHSFTALSTGGFSPHDASIEFYRLSDFPHFIWIEYILIVGMIMGGMNFLIHFRVLMGEPKALIDNMEMRYWWSMIGLFVIIIMAERFFKIIYPFSLNFTELGFWKQVEEDFRIVLFQVVSILTTTGFGTRDIGSPFFGQVARQLFLLMMVIGGCVGSTGGGIKVLRVGILAKLIKREVFRLHESRRTLATILINGEPLSNDEVYRVSGLFFMWIFLLFIGGLITTFLSRFDGYTAYSGMFSALGNIGPCYIPVAEMGQLHPIVKVTYILGMLTGRLEILPVLLLFSPRAWTR